MDDEKRLKLNASPDHGGVKKKIGGKKLQKVAEVTIYFWSDKRLASIKRIINQLCFV